MTERFLKISRDWNSCRSFLRMDIDIEENGEAEDVVGDFLYAGIFLCIRLLTVARAGDEEWLLELLATRPELVSEVDENGNTALHLSSANGHAGIEHGKGV